MDALGIASAPMIGNSMGGVVGVNLAIRKPDRVEKLVTIGGVGPNLFSPSPSEGLRLLQEFADDPDRDKLVRWLTAMVYDRTLVTEELISERWEVAMNPDAWPRPERCTAQHLSRCNSSSCDRRHPAVLGDDAQDLLPDAAHLGPRRPGQSARHGAGPDAADPRRTTARLSPLWPLGDDRAKEAFERRWRRSWRADRPLSRFFPKTLVLPSEIARGRTRTLGRNVRTTSGREPTPRPPIG